LVFKPQNSLKVLWVSFVFKANGASVYLLCHGKEPFQDYAERYNPRQNKLSKHSKSIFERDPLFRKNTLNKTVLSDRLQIRNEKKEILVFKM